MSKDAEELPQMLTVKELKKYLRIGRNQAYELCQDPNFPTVRIGKSIRIPKNQLLKWVQNDNNNQTFDKNEGSNSDVHISE